MYTFSDNNQGNKCKNDDSDDSMIIINLNWNKFEPN